MSRLLFAALLALLPLAGCADTQEQALVDRATLTVQELFESSDASGPRSLLQQAKGALICPRIFKAGFFVGGQGGECVLVGRGPSGWTAPAFYDIGSGSFGFQIGVQDAEVVFIVLTERGLQALLDSQFKIGADASVAVATLGGGISGSTTAALRADIVAFAKTSGLFAGIAVDGSLISSRSGSNQTYYGHAVGAQQIVLQGDVSNAGAAPLKEVLARYSGGG